MVSGDGGQTFSVNDISPDPCYLLIKKRELVQSVERSLLASIESFTSTERSQVQVLYSRKKLGRM